MPADDARSEMSPAALAAEMMKEVDASAQALEPPRSPKASARDRAPASAAALRASGADEGLDLRETGKAAVLWVKQAFPWLRAEEDEQDAGASAMPPLADLAGAPMAGDASAASSRAHLVTLPYASDTAARERATAVDYAVASRTTGDQEENPVRLAISFIRMVVGHPMTWLVLSLVVIGGVVAKKIDRRPTK